jgi:hypothetical protein
MTFVSGKSNAKVGSFEHQARFVSKTSFSGWYRIIAIVEEPFEQFALLRFIDEDCRFVASTHRALKRHEERSDWTAHPGMEPRVLS